MIELKNVSKNFKTKSGTIEALKDVCLSIDDGDIFGIIGFSGAGKSTLVRCMNLLERPDSGKVFVDGEDMLSLSTEKLLQKRRDMGMIFQSFNLFEQKTVYENVMFPLKISGKGGRAADGKVKELLKTVGLEGREKSYPSQLSGGQKQRVAIARALATEPKYLLCDEATSALDPKTASSVLALLKELNRTLGITLVVITHEMRVIESVCTKVAVLSEGSIAGSGRVEEVFYNPESEAVKDLVFLNPCRDEDNAEGYRIEIVLNGAAMEESVISAVSLRLNKGVKVLYSDEKSYGGKLYGRVIISARDLSEKTQIIKICSDLGISVKEAV